ncbi:MAG: 50S ribosomal protein L16 [Candidatus Nanoarchaeia archaeon]
MGLRPAHCYTKVERAYTRKSKYKNKAYVKAAPISKIMKYEMGDIKKDFPVKVNLVSKQPIQIRHNALESARVVVNRHLSEALGNNFKLFLKLYPHHVLRENKMLTGAGADRMQSGMQHAFGRPVGLAARVKKGQVVFSAEVDSDGVDVARNALAMAKPRLPGKFTIQVISK